MSVEKAKKYLKEKGYLDRVIEPDVSTATVELAAAAIGVEPGRICKSLSFIIDDRPILILAEGMARVDNKKYKQEFGKKAKMIQREQVEELIGHEAGGVCQCRDLSGREPEEMGYGVSGGGQREQRGEAGTGRAGETGERQKMGGRVQMTGRLYFGGLAGN